MYFLSKFLEISKPIHFRNREIMRDQKINVGICADTDKAAILEFQNGRHKIQFLRYFCFYVFRAKESNGGIIRLQMLTLYIVA